MTVYWWLWGAGSGGERRKHDLPYHLHDGGDSGYDASDDHFGDAGERSHGGGADRTDRADVLEVDEPVDADANHGGILQQHYTAAECQPADVQSERVGGQPDGDAVGLQPAGVDRDHGGRVERGAGPLGERAGALSEQFHDSGELRHEQAVGGEPAAWERNGGSADQHGQRGAVPERGDERGDGAGSAAHLAERAAGDGHGERDQCRADDRVHAVGGVAVWGAGAGVSGHDGAGRERQRGVCVPGIFLENRCFQPPLLVSELTKRHEVESP